MKLLVVGGAGYIGSVVAGQLLAAGHDVTVADNLVRRHRDAVPTDAHFAVDLLHAPSVRDLVARGFDGVLHFAAQSLVAESLAESVGYFRLNVGGTLNLLDALRIARVARLVFSSTAAVYGEPEEVPISEDAPTKPTNPYGASKLAVDQAIAFHCAATGRSACATSMSPTLLGTMVNATIRRRTSFLWCSQPRPVPGAACKYSAPTTPPPTAPPSGTTSTWRIPAGPTFSPWSRSTVRATASNNLGNGEGFSVRQVLDVATAVTGRPIRARARRDLGGKPEKPELKAMVADAWAYARRGAS